MVVVNMAEKKLEIFNYLRSINCCKVCCLRFLEGRTDDFSNVDEALKKLKFNDEKIEPDAKRCKENVCVACLGLFTDDFLMNVVCQIRECEDLGRFECDSFVASISLPIILHLRQLSIWIDLLAKFECFNKGEY